MESTSVQDDPDQESLARELATEPVPPPAKPRRRWRIWAIVVASVLLLATAGTGGIGWYYSQELLTPRHNAPTFPDLLHGTGTAAGGPTLILAESERTLQPGTFGLTWSGGLARVGEIVGRAGGKVERKRLDSVEIPAGSAVRMDDDVWKSDPKAAHGLDFQELTLPTELGPAPSWLVRGAPGKDASTWVIAVHGRGGTRTETLRVLPALHKLGLPVLSVTYRNDVGAPASPDGYYHLGDTEWRDVEIAVRTALGNGARRVVLFGWSMGGAIVEQLMARSEHAGSVSAVVLDSPVVSWRKTLEFQAGRRGMPAFLTPVAEWVSSWRSGVQFGPMELIDAPPPSKPPTLLIHGAADTTVPVQASRDLAIAAGRLGWPLEYVEVPGSDHVAAWNADPAGYERTLTTFLRTRLGLATP